MLVRRTFFGILTAALLSTTAHAETLQEALEAAYRNNPELDAARAQQRANDELVPQALSDFRPSVAATAGAELNTGNNNFGSQDFFNRGVGLEVRQNLYRGGSSTAALRQAENLVRVGRAQLHATEQQILGQAAQAFTQVWRDRSVVALAENNVNRLRRQLQATRDRFNVGEVARTDVAQAEARLAQAQAELIAAQGTLEVSEATYARVVGEPAPANVEQPVTPAGLPESEAAAQEIAARNPQLVAARYQLAAARDDVDVQKGALLPTIDLNASAGYADEPQASVDWQNQASVGVAVSVPLYQGGGEYARVRQSKQTLQQRMRDLDAASLAVREQVTSAWAARRAAIAAIQSLRAQVRANQIALEGVQQEALVGSRTVIDVLDAENELFTSQVDLVRAQTLEINSAYQLLAAIGMLTAPAQDLRVEPYNVEKHYTENRDRLFGLGDPIEPVEAFTPQQPN